MKRLLLTVALTAAMAATPPPTTAATKRNPYPLKVTDDLGRSVRLNHRPRRIISLFADYTEMLFALGLEKRIVGDGSKYAEVATGITNAAGKPRAFRYPSEWPSRLGRDYPIRAPRITHVEGGFSSQPFDLETIQNLQPDLIVAPYYKSQDPVYQKMRDLGLTVFFLNPGTVGGVMKDLTLLGRVTGAQRQASAVVRVMRAQLRDVRSHVARTRSRPAVYYEIDASNPTQPYTAGPGTIPDQAIHIARAGNIADTVSTCQGTACYPAFSTETIVAANPRVIVLADAAYGITPASVKARPGYETVAAVRSNRVYAINPDLLSKFGPRIVIGVRAMARLVHPNAFKRG